VLPQQLVKQQRGQKNKTHSLFQSNNNCFKN
jgi:hypothetical protein